MKAESHSTCGAKPSSLGVGDQPAKGRGPEPLGICLEVGMGTVKGLGCMQRKQLEGEPGTRAMTDLLNVTPN